VKIAILMKLMVLSEALGRRNKAASVASDETENLFMDMLREINLWEQGHDRDPENVNEIRQQIIRDLDQAAHNFGDTTAPGCRPSCQLQFGRQFVLSQPIICRFDNTLPVRFGTGAQERIDRKSKANQRSSACGEKGEPDDCRETSDD
jgi:hypothetical protein